MPGSDRASPPVIAGLIGNLINATGPVHTSNWPCEGIVFSRRWQLLLGCRHSMFVEVFRRKAYFIIPINSPAVKGIISEILRILEFDENALVVQLGEVEQTHVAIAEGEPQQVAGDILGAGDV